MEHVARLEPVQQTLPAVFGQLAKVRGAAACFGVATSSNAVGQTLVELDCVAAFGRKRILGRSPARWTFLGFTHPFVFASFTLVITRYYSKFLAGTSINVLMPFSKFAAFMA